MHLIHNEHTACQQSVPHVGMPYFERTEQCLVNRAHGDSCGQKPFGIFGHPALVRYCIGGTVMPQNFKIRQIFLSDRLRLHRPAIRS